jgi:hypothetical protein
MQREILYQIFKYSVYAFLTANIFIFFREEYHASQLQFADGMAFGQWLEAYAASIDTTAWVLLLLMFELETYVLSDEQLTPPVALALHAFRAVCYAVIVFAFYGYVANVVVIGGASPLPDVADLCTLAADNWSYAVDLDEYVALTGENCRSLSPSASFYQLPGFDAVVDQRGLTDISRLAWVDVINAGVWILVVIVLEIDVRLQERNRLTQIAYRLSYATKFILYSTLLLAAIYWGFKGDFVDFWDAFLWLVAFVFIELNVVQWREETIQESA